jgi:hypothetical protein
MHTVNREHGEEDERGTYKLGSVESTVAETAALSPVRILRSKRRDEDSMMRTSAGTLAPRMILMISPDTSSAAGILAGVAHRQLGRCERFNEANSKVLPSRMTRTALGSIPEMEAMTLPVE